MGGEWTSTTLGAICSFATGSAFPKSAQGDMVGKYPFIKVSDMNLPGNDRFITIANNWVSKETQARLRAKVHPEGSTVFAKIGVALTYNRRRILTQPALIDNNMMAAIPIAGLVDHLFFYYMLCTIDFNEVAVGTALPYLNISDLSRITVRLPSLKDQQAIACILGTLDDKIELLRRMSETLEAMARALFKSWFIDFDPVRAKAAVRRKHPDWTNDQVSRAACPNLKPEIAALFPDSFEDSELGQIPKGWEVTTLGDFVEFVKGRSYRSDELSSSDTALVTLKSFVRGGGYRIDGLKPFTGAYIPKQVVEPGEVVLACTDVTQAGEVIGRTAIVRGSRTYSCLVASLDVLIIRPRPPLTRSFVYELGHSADFVDHTYAHTIGTTVLHLSTDAVAAFPFAMPPSALIDRYDQIAVPIIQRSEAIGGNSEMLAAIRDALLPKLISNELRIPDAESFIALAQAAAMEATS